MAELSKTSSATHKSNFLRAALGEFISFGRYLSESLDWQKWSIFTENRYVEEAKKYSQPGSVDAKIAYFEAQYKRRASEKAVALVEEANPTFDSETDKIEINKDGEIDLEIKSEAVSI